MNLEPSFFKNQFNFSGKVAIITGGSSGIGFETARILLAGGARVLLTGRDGIKGEKAVRELEKQPGPKVNFLKADVSKPDQCEKIVCSTIKLYGKIDIVINNAGVFKANPIENVTEKEFDWIVDTNLKGAFFICKYAVPFLKRNRAGAVINVSSDAGLQGNKLSSAYCASKGGLTLFTKALALDLASFGIRVNCVCPGDISTPMLDKDLETRSDPKQYLNALTESYPVGRLGDPEEVAWVICFLASGASDFVTGAAWSVDGGIT
ncbi:MAG: SDR family oxidoreductase, partial [Desulfotignum sp.]|nr:SDR family oxidoreductase [Desulfotignum sp.]